MEDIIFRSINFCNRGVKYGQSNWPRYAFVSLWNLSHTSIIYYI